MLGGVDVKIYQPGDTQMSQGLACRADDHPYGQNQQDFANEYLLTTCEQSPDNYGDNPHQASNCNDQPQHSYCYSQPQNKHCHGQTQARFGYGQQSENYGYDQPQDNFSQAEQIGYEQRTPSSVVATQPGPANVIDTNHKQSDLTIPAILVCLCCFWPTGIFAICRAVQAQQAAKRGDMILAESRQKLAEGLITKSIIAGFTMTMLYVVLLIMSGSEF